MRLQGWLDKTWKVVFFLILSVLLMMIAILARVMAASNQNNNNSYRSSSSSLNLPWPYLVGPNSFLVFSSNSSGKKGKKLEAMHRAISIASL